MDSIKVTYSTAGWASVCTSTDRLIKGIIRYFVIEYLESLKILFNFTVSTVSWPSFFSFSPAFADVLHID